MAINQLLNAFNAGEVSPLLDARTDLQSYFSGCRVLENMVPFPYGPAIRRPGTEYLQHAKFSDLKSRLIPFVFSEEARYQIELGQFYMRFWDVGTGSLINYGDLPPWITGTDYKVGDFVVESGDNYRCLIAHTSGVFATDLANEDWELAAEPQEVITPYFDYELDDIQFAQINDVMYLVHPNHPPFRLLRLAYNGSIYFSGADMIPDWPPLLEENVIDGTTISASAPVAGIVTLTASAPVFNPFQEGAYFQLRIPRATAYTRKDASSNGNSTPLYVFGAWTFSTFGTWTGDFTIDRSPNGVVGFTPIRTYHSNSDRNVATSGYENTPAYLSVGFSNRVVGTANDYGFLEATDASVYGIYQIISYTSPTSVTARVIIDSASTSATAFWSEGAWSNDQGFPRTIEAHENRIMYGGTMLKPQSVWGSQIDNYQNFRTGTLATDGLFFTIAENRTSQIQWMKSKDGFLLVGREGSEGRIYASDPSSTLSPSDINWTHTTSYGSRHIPAVILNDALLFIQGQGRKIRSLAQIPTNSGYPSFSGADVTILSEHITKTGIVAFAAQNLPDAILWCIREDGTLIGMSYDSLNSAIAWHRHTTQGFFESVSTVPGTYGDEVWFIVRREIDGTTQRFVERFDTLWRESWETEDKDEWVYLDASIRVLNGPPNVVVNVGDHLEGMTVGCLSDGADAGEFVVTGGQITLTTPGAINIVGLSYNSLLRPMKLVMQTGNGPSRARTARISNVKVQLLKSLGMDISTDGVDYSDALFRSDQDNMDESPPVQSGLFDWTAPGDYNQDGGDFWIRQTHPMPLCVVATTPIWETGSN